jgi:lipopolysaccharide/colanic/teichoic acid biosynthesis glycosyltransferase
MRAPDMAFQSPPRPVSTGAFVRRAFDVALAGSVLVCMSPFMVLVAAAVLIDSGQPILFKHPRIGAFGQPFNMYKFRKFHQDCSAKGLQLTLTNDSRLTRVGKFLAESKLDELPQLWNVLKGDMAIVGPRPESLEFLDCYRAGFEEVLHFKPGLIGPSQVFFRDEAFYYPADEDPTTFYRQIIFPTKAGLDIAYFRHRTLWSDFKWIFRSGLAVVGFA